MKYFNGLILSLFFIGCQEPSNWNVNNKYYEIVDGLQNRILNTWNNKSAFCEVYSRVLQHKNDSSFILVKQEPVLDYYFRDLCSFLTIRFNSQINGYKPKETYQEKYWGNYSDSINELILKRNNPKIERATHEFDFLVQKLADSLINNNPFHKKVFEYKENYWIIDLKIDSLYGPYQRLEYLEQKEKLGVSKNLKLDIE